MRRRRAAFFEQPSLVPMADMVTNTVGVILFILIFVSLSAGGIIVSRHVPRERKTAAKAIWMLCSGGRIAEFDAEALGAQFEKTLGAPTPGTAREWVRNYAERTMMTDQFDLAGEAQTEPGTPLKPASTIRKNLLISLRKKKGDDANALNTPGSSFQRLLTEKDKTANFFFIFVRPDSVALFRAARDQLTQAGFGVGWSPLGPTEPARIALSGSGREATIQ